MAQHSIATIRNVLITVCADPRISRIVLFGSHAKGQGCEQSDIDLYLDSNGQISGFHFFALKAEIEEALDAEVDLLSDLDVVPGSSVEQEISRYGVTVYAR